MFPISASFERRDLFLLFKHVNAGSTGMNVLSLSISCSCGCILLVPITLTYDILAKPMLLWNLSSNGNP